MNLTLKIVISVVLLLCILLIIKRLQHQKLSIRYGVAWIILIILMIISIVFLDFYYDISKFLGFEKTSNMVFLFGFFFLFYLNFILITNISVLNEKVKNLVQEVSILKEKVEKNKKTKENK